MPRSPVLLAVAVLLVLSGCSAGHESAASPSPTPTVSPTPTATVTSSPVSLPAECTDVVAADVYQKQLATLPLNASALTSGGGFGAVAPTTPTKGATFEQRLTADVQLRCLWQQPGGDGSGMELTLARVRVDDGTSYLSKAKLLHWSCADTDGGRECQQVGTDKKSHLDTLHIVFLRDDVFIDVTQTNVIVDDIIGSVVARIWH